MASPFKIFRKNAKVLLVGLFLISMISFVIIPALLEYLGATRGSNIPPVVVTKRFGSLSEQQLANLWTGQAAVQRFLEALQDFALRRQGNTLQIQLLRQTLGELSEEQVVRLWLLARYAEAAGMVVSDPVVNRYVQDLVSSTGIAISEQDVQGLIQQQRISEDAFFSGMSLALLAMRYAELSGVDPWRFLPGYAGETPGQRWDYFLRLHRLASVELAEVPVETFAAKVTPPTDAQLRELFEKRKTHLPQPNSPEPGFKVPEKVRVEYLKGDVTVWLEGHSIPEEELRRVYEERKDELFLTPQTSAALPIATGPGLPSTEPPETTPTPPAGTGLPPEGVSPVSEGAPVPGSSPQSQQGVPVPGGTPPSQQGASPAQEMPVPEGGGGGEGPAPAASEGPAMSGESAAQQEAPEQEAAEQEKREKEKGVQEEKAGKDEKGGQPSEQKATQDEPVGQGGEGGSTPQQPAEGQTPVPAADQSRARWRGVVRWVSLVEESAGSPQGGTSTAPEASSPQAGNSDGAPATESASQPQPETPSSPESQPSGEMRSPPESQPSGEQQSQSQAPGAGESDPVPAGSAGSATQPQPPTEAGPASQNPPEKSKYRPFDEVREEVRRLIAGEQMRTVLDKIEEGMRRYQMAWGNYLSAVESAKESKAVPPEPPQRPNLEELARREGFQYGRTDLLPRWEMAELEIGQSADAQGTPFAQIVYDLREFMTVRTFDLNQNQYLAWPTEREEEHVPEFTDPGVKDEVLRAWRLMEGRKLAETECSRLASAAEKSGKTLADFLAGNKELAGIRIVPDTDPFTWMTYGDLNLAWAARRPPFLSSIKVKRKDPASGLVTDEDAVDQPGNDFMEAVFRLQPGQVGVAWNQPKSKVYLVRVIEMQPSPAQLYEAFVRQNEQTYISVSWYDRIEAYSRWSRNLEEEAGLRWNRAPARAARR